MGKIFNDPVYGFITIPYGLVFELIEHPYYQRLRRIKQLGLTHYVYPGALHTRFHHALGAYHLMMQAIEVLRSKGVDVSPEEAEAVGCAILLHDIGHGPFSHALEHKLVNVHHEELTILFMERLNTDLGGRLQMALEIFTDRYPKKFLHQLISGQLDMDRLDYLTRDSFFTGVYEGVVGYDRIIKMLDVRNDRLVVEEKGIYSVEKFLVSRRLMYWQAYLHKTALCSELMLVKVVERARQLLAEGHQLPMTNSLRYFLSNEFTPADFIQRQPELLDHFARLDDFDIVSAIKEWMFEKDFVLSFLSKGIIDRKLYKVTQQVEPFDKAMLSELRERAQAQYGVGEDLAQYFVITASESNRAYNSQKDEILILRKNGDIRPVSEWSDQAVHTKTITRHYLCFPKGLKTTN